MQMILQGFGQRICQEQNAGASDFHARTSALQEKQQGFGQRSSLFLQLQALLEDRRKKINPLAYSLKTLKTYLVLTEGLILQGSSWSWMKSGTMQSGRFLNTSDVLPQNRERIFIVGHLRGRST